MIIWILQIVAGVITLTKVVIERYIPENVTKKRKFHMKRKVVAKLEARRLITIQNIADWSKAHEFD